MLWAYLCVSPLLVFGAVVCGLAAASSVALLVIEAHQSGTAATPLIMSLIFSGVHLSGMALLLSLLSLPLLWVL